MLTFLVKKINQDLLMLHFLNCLLSSILGYTIIGIYIKTSQFSRFLGLGIFCELGICKLEVWGLTTSNSRILKFSTQFANLGGFTEGNTSNWEGFFFNSVS